MKNKMPATWRFLKIDLFDNASNDELIEGKRRLKLAFSVRKEDSSDWMYFRALMNSPRRTYKRFVEEDWDWKHYNTVLKHYDELRKQIGVDGIERVNISKVYQKGWAESKHTIEGMSAMLIQTKDNYMVRFYVNDFVMDLELDTHNISAKQRKQNVIATATVSNSSGYTRKRAGDFV